MADYSTAVKSAISSLSSLATGGIYLLDDLGRGGLNKTNISAAYTNGIIKPTIVIKERNTTHIMGMDDDPNHISAGSLVVEIWLYQDSGFATIKLMKAAIFPLLHGVRLSIGGHIYWNHEVTQERDVILDASVERVDYKIIHIKGG